MRFLLDESMPASAGSFLRSRDHDATAVGLDYPHALRDREILRLAHEEERILVTSDSDFGELIFRFHLPHRGLIFFRLRDERPAAIGRWLGYVLDTMPHLLTAYLVVSESGIRVRPPAGNGTSLI
jgi:predicted nuclease of predicted toxin-antitoxin system